MKNLSLIEVSKPEELKNALNELINYKNTAGDLPNITAESLGLGNVDNTSDANKPVSSAQKTYIDNENAKDVKLESETMQTIDSDIEIADGKSLYGERGNGTTEQLVVIKNEGGFENVEIGSPNIPLKLHHSMKDINNSSLTKNPKVSVKDANGETTEEKMAFISDIQTTKTELNTALSNEINKKINKSSFASAETPNAIVTEVLGESFDDSNTDAVNIKVIKRSVDNGSILLNKATSLKLASTTSRGLMSKEQVSTLNDLSERMQAMEGKASRYLYDAKTNPSASEIDTFVKSMGHTVPFTGIAVVIDETFHVWHYYENENIGWKDDGSDTVSKATNSSLGIVKGETSEGKVSVENDGTMSLVGYDTLKSKVTSIENSRLNDVDIAGGTNNGTIKVTKNVNGTSSTTDNISVTGLKSAAYTESSAYATSEQGEKADTAIQSIKLNGVEQTKTNNGINLVIDTVSQSTMQSYVQQAIEDAIGEVIGGSY